MKKKRVQFDFTPEALTRLDHIVAVMGAASRAEVVRRALALLDIAVEEQGAGRDLYIGTGAGRVRVVF